MKTCFKCNLAKPIGQFYRHPAMLDGYLGKCKQCALEYARAHRKTHGERIRAYDRQRANADQRTIDNRERVKKIRASGDQERINRLNDGSRRYNARNPEKYRARNMF